MFIKQPKMQDLWVAFPRKTVTHVIFRLPNVYTILYIHINVRFRQNYRKYSFKVWILMFSVLNDVIYAQEYVKKLSDR